MARFILITGIVIPLLFGEALGATTTTQKAVQVFEDAQELCAKVENIEDLSFKDALTDLMELIERGNQLVRNHNIEDAIVVAEQVIVQMELIKILERFVLFKSKLKTVQAQKNVLQKKKRALESQYRKLLLQTKGHVLTGAFPHNDHDMEGAN